MASCSKIDDVGVSQEESDDRDSDNTDKTATPRKKKRLKCYCMFNSERLKEFQPWLAKIDDFTANCIYIVSTEFLGIIRRQKCCFVLIFYSGVIQCFAAIVNHLIPFEFYIC